MRHYPFKGITYTVGIILSLGLTLWGILFSQGATPSPESLSLPSISTELFHLSEIALKALYSLWILLLGGALYWLYEKSTLLEKHVGNLCFLIFICLAAAMGINVTFLGSLLMTIAVISLTILLNGTSAKSENSGNLIVGIGTSILFLQHPVYASLLIAWILIAYMVKSLSLRFIMAMLLGFALVPIIIGPIAIYKLTLAGTLSNLQSWMKLSYAVHFPTNLRAIIFLVFSFLSFMTYTSGLHKENTKQRSLGSSLLSLGIVSSTFSIFYPNIGLEILAVIPTSLMSARAICLLQGRSYSIALIIFAVLIIALALSSQINL